ncbi:MAG: glycosyl transferase family protein [Magnetospirillum sp.]|nr:glycosyl transferase family protein [Magnetospirillum sp.]
MALAIFGTLAPRPGRLALLSAGLALVLAVALAAALHMEEQGHWVTGMTNHVVWGLPHVFAIFLIVAASGALNVASVASVFGKAAYKPLARLSGLVAVALLAGGLAVLVLDLGRPDRLMVAVTNFNPTSIFAWNVVLYSGFVAIVALYLACMMAPRLAARVRAAGTAAFVWRLVLTTGTGSIFGFLVARDAFHSALMAPLFIAMSLAFGLAVFLLVLDLLAALGGSAPEPELGGRLGRLLGVFVAANLYFVAVWHLTNLYAANGRGLELFLLAEGGVYTALFWLGQVGLGGLLPLVLLWWGRSAAARRLAAALVVLGGLAQLYVQVIGGQVVPMPLIPGRQLHSAFGDGAVAGYGPSVYEPGAWPRRRGAGPGAGAGGMPGPALPALQPSRGLAMTVAIADRPEHPFAPFVRILGKGPHMSRTLSEEEAFAAARMVFAGAVEPVQLGAFLCLVRMMTETPEELAGFVRAARETVPRPADAPAVDFDWPAYAGKRRRPPWFLLSALLLAENGMRVFMHGLDGHTAGRLYIGGALAALGIRPAAGLDEAASRLRACGFAYMSIERLCPPLYRLMELKPLLGLRNPVHTMVRMLNPFDARCQMIGVAHAPYRILHQQAARLLGQNRLAVFRGDGGEAERPPADPCQVVGLVEGGAVQEVWPALADAQPPPPAGGDLDVLRRVWLGEDSDAEGEAAAVGTAAVALKALGRAADRDQAAALAAAMWRERSRCPPGQPA